MPGRKLFIGLWTLAIATLAIPSVVSAAGQAFVKHQNLSEMVAEADRIYRGTVVSSESGEVGIGQSTIPATTFRIIVTELFKGEADQQNGEKSEMELKAVGTDKRYLRTVGDYAQLPVLPELPQLSVGDEVLMFTNAPNQYGLSNTIGLGQGYFHISEIGDDEMTTNQLQNLGLFKDMGTGMPVKGDVAYAELASLINAELNR